MDRQRSYLDNINAGRQRRPQTSLDQLTRSLAKLEQQLDMQASGQSERPIYQQDRQRLRNEAVGYHSQPSQAYRAQDHRAQVEQAYRAPADQNYRKRQEPNYRAQAEAQAPRAHAEYSRPQQESRQLASELDALRSEMQNLLGESKGHRAAQSRAEADANEIKSEIERLTSSVQGLTRRNDDKAVNALRLELEQARAAIDSLAREETVRSISQRWEDFEERMLARQPAASAGPDFGELASRIDDMHAALDRLPESLPLRSIEDKFRTLSTAVEGLLMQRATDVRDDEPLRRLEDRMDDIARTIAAASQTPAAFDTDSLDRFERRLDDISRSIVNVGANAYDDTGLERLEARIAGLSRQIEEQIARPVEQPSFDQDRIVDAIESRLDELQARFANDKSGRAFQNIEDRLDDLASRFDQPMRMSGGVDPLTVSNLEAQIANLSEFLSRPEPGSSMADDIAPRLDRLERSIHENRDLVVSAASQAAEEAVRRMGNDRSPENDVAIGLVSDLQELESLTRRSDERNTKTFEAIHDTLLKIVDRLGSIEQSERAAVAPAYQPAPYQPAAAPYQPVASTPPLAPEEHFDPVEDFRPEPPRRQISPAQAAAAAAAAALDESALEPPAGRSMLGGLTRRLTGREPAPTLAGSSVTAEMPSVELDAPIDPKAVNRPLEPGSGAPDLSAIMRRVRDERTPSGRANVSDAANADFLARARRAAQAAAAEAQVLKASASDQKAGSKKGGLLEMISARRKPILMAAVAVMIALAGIQATRTMFSGPAPAAQSAQPASESTITPPAKIAEPKAELVAPAAETPAVRQAESNAQSAAAPQETSQQASVLDDEGPDVPLSSEEAAEYEAEAEITAKADPIGQPAPGAIALADIPVEAGPIPLREAAAGGDSKALFEIGARYADGRGVKANMQDAAKWYEKSADLGFAPAQYRIGNFYEKGNGVARDINKAKTWYQLAANQGNASAMHNLAVLFAMGTDGPVDNDSAARWFTQAAEYGVKDSQFNLGILAAKAVGMPKNLEESYKWFALVAKAGDRDAASKRDEIAKSLRPEQLERARASVELWKAKEPNAEANTVDIPESWQESQAVTASVDMKKAIRNVQGILNKNGYDAGAADGVMGERTKIAIKAFQKDNGMAPSGNVDKALVEALLAKN